MKILLVGTGSNLPIPPNGWGGVEKVIWNHNVQLEKKGHPVDIFNGKDPQELKARVMSGSYDIIHSHFHRYNEIMAKMGIPYVYTCHAGSWVKNWGSYEKVFNDSFCYPLPFEEMGRRMSKEHHSIWNGADPETFKPAEKRKKQCVAVGRYEPRKNFEKVVNIIKDKPEYELFLVGPDNERFRGIPNVIVLGNMPEHEVGKLMGCSEFFFHLADEEADCLVVKEAGMCGCKMVLSPYNAAVFGFSASWNDPEALSICRDIFAEKALELSQQKYTWEKVVDNLLVGYDKFLAWRKSL